MLIVEQNAALALDLADQRFPDRDRRHRHVGQCRRNPRQRNHSRRLSRLLRRDAATDGATDPATGDRHRHRRHLRLHGARHRHDLPGDPPPELRPGRDGDVLDLHRLAAAAVGPALLARHSAYRGGLLRRRRGDRAHRHPPARQCADPEPHRRLHRPLRRHQQPRRLHLGLHHQALPEPVRQTVRSWAVSSATSRSA